MQYPFIKKLAQTKKKKKYCDRIYSMCDRIYSNSTMHLLDFETLNYILIKIKKLNNIRMSIIAIIRDDSESSRQYNKGRKKLEIKSLLLEKILVYSKHSN